MGSPRQTAAQQAQKTVCNLLYLHIVWVLPLFRFVFTIQALRLTTDEVLSTKVWLAELA